jgi:hypothetical protein
MFRHEHRRMNQIMRHHYVAKLLTVESLFENAKNQSEFVENYGVGIKKLPIFEQIHAECDDEEDDMDTLECSY